MIDSRKRVQGRRRVTEYLIKWKGCPLKNKTLEKNNNKTCVWSNFKKIYFFRKLYVLLWAIPFQETRPIFFRRKWVPINFGGNHLKILGLSGTSFTGSRIFWKNNGPCSDGRHPRSMDRRILGCRTPVDRTIWFDWGEVDYFRRFLMDTTRTFLEQNLPGRYDVCTVQSNGLRMCHWLVGRLIFPNSDWSRLVDSRTEGLEDRVRPECDANGMIGFAPMDRGCSTDAKIRRTEVRRTRILTCRNA